MYQLIVEYRDGFIKKKSYEYREKARTAEWNEYVRSGYSSHGHVEKTGIVKLKES